MCKQVNYPKSIMERFNGGRTIKEWEEILETTILGTGSFDRLNENLSNKQGTLLYPLECFTIEDIKLLGKNITVDVCNHGHSHSCYLFDKHIDMHELDDNDYASIRSILCYICFLYNRLEKFKEMEDKQGTNITDEEYLTDIMTKINTCVVTTLEKGEKVYPVYILNVLGLDYDDLYDYESSSLYSVINCFVHDKASVNAKAIEINLKSLEYIKHKVVYALISLSSSNNQADKIIQEFYPEVAGEKITIEKIKAKHEILKAIYGEDYVAVAFENFNLVFGGNCLEDLDSESRLGFLEGLYAYYLSDVREKNMKFKATICFKNNGV